MRRVGWFGVAMGLQSPSEIQQIPNRLLEYRPSKKTADSCWEAIMPKRFEEILAGRRAASIAPIEMQRGK